MGDIHNLRGAGDIKTRLRLFALRLLACSGISPYVLSPLACSRSSLLCSPMQRPTVAGSESDVDAEARADSDADEGQGLMRSNAGSDAHVTSSVSRGPQPW